MSYDFVGKCFFVKTRKKKVLVIGDLHLGYEEHLNKSGVFVSKKLFEETINYLERVFDKIGSVEEVVLLGDVKHDFGSIGKQEWRSVLDLFRYFSTKCKKIIITKGNHDIVLAPIVKKREIVELKDFYSFGKYCFAHGNRYFEQMRDKKIKVWILGHGHPAVKISDGTKTEKYKCFLIGKFKGKQIIILPSFLDFPVGSDPRENNLGMACNFNLNDFVVFVVQENNLEVLDFGKLGKIN